MAEQQRIVLLNHMRSRSVSRARVEYPPPVQSGLVLVRDIIKRGKYAIEFEGLAEKDDWKDDDRLAAGKNYPALRLRRSRFDAPTEDDPGYAVLLLEHLDPMRKSFQVVDVETFDGRELSAEKTEAGSLSAHVMIRFPANDLSDHGMYRCVVESASPITRARIEWFLCRQIRRLAPEWTFPVDIQKKRKVVRKLYHFTPKLELLADAGRALSATDSKQREISMLRFTKIGMRQTVGGASEIKDRELVADVELRIKASQGPEGEVERAGWAAELIAAYKALGYKSKIYFRHATGGVLGGDVTHHQIESAHDLLLCPKDFINVPAGHKPWTDRIDGKTVDQMKALLDNDELWEHAK